MNAGRDHDCRGRSTFDACAHEANIFEFGRRTFLFRLRVVEFLDRERFASQAALTHESVFRGQQPHIARNHVAGGQLDDIPGHQVAQRNLASRAVPHNRGGHVNHGFEFLSGGIRAGFLPEAQAHTQCHHDGHYDPGTRVTGKKGNCRQNRK